jgi:hypothetical protein
MGPNRMTANPCLGKIVTSGTAAKRYFGASVGEVMPATLRRQKFASPVLLDILELAWQTDFAMALGDGMPA